MPNDNHLYAIRLVYHVENKKKAKNFCSHQTIIHYYYLDKDPIEEDHV